MNDKQRLIKTISDRLRADWSFDNWQCHTHTWHAKADFIEWLGRLEDAAGIRESESLEQPSPLECILTTATDVTVTAEVE